MGWLTNPKIQVIFGLLLSAFLAILILSGLKIIEGRVFGKEKSQ